MVMASDGELGETSFSGGVGEEIGDEGGDIVDAQSLVHLYVHFSLLFGLPFLSFPSRAIYSLAHLC